MAQAHKAGPQVALPQGKAGTSSGVPEGPEKGRNGTSPTPPRQAASSGAGSSGGQRSGSMGASQGLSAAPTGKQSSAAMSPANAASPPSTTAGSPPAGGTGAAGASSPTASAPASSAAAPGESRKISCEDIQLVQNLIERCLQLYMNQREVMTTLQQQARIEPGFTGLVWQKLEEQNPEFFRAYYTRLKVKEQMLQFNHLLEQHSQLLQKLRMAPPPGGGSQKMMAPAPGLPSAMPPPVHGAPLGYPIHRPAGLGCPPMPAHGGMGRHAGGMTMPPPHGPMPSPYAPHGGGRTRPGLMDMPAIGVPSTGLPAHSLPPHSHPSANVHGSPSENGHHMGGEAAGMDGGADEAGSRGGGGGSGGELGGGGSAFPFANTELGLGLGLGLPLALEGPPFGGGGGGAMGGLGHEADVGLPPAASRESLGGLGQLPRNFSLSDLAAEFPSGIASDGGMMSALGSSPPYIPGYTEAYLRSPDKDEDEKLLDPMNEIDFSDLK